MKSSNSRPPPMEASTTSFFTSPPQAAAAAPTGGDAVSLDRLSTNLERLLDPSFPNRADTEIVLASGGSGDEPGAAAIVGAHSCILAARSSFFLQYFSSIPASEKARLNLADMVPGGRHIGRDALVAVLGYLYTGRLKVPPDQKCVDDTCRHEACRPAMDFVVESTYAASGFEIPALVSLLQVTVLVNDHTCVSSMRMATTTPNCKWVALWAASILRAEPNIGARELQKRLETDHKCEIAYDTVWRGKAKALDEVYGKWSESFQLLYRWKAEVEKRSPGSVVEIDVLEVDGEVYFHRFFCALKPCIDGFLEGCRPHLSIDATALNGRWNGHLAAAVAVDGHNWMYPVAYGFIASETTVNWTWFMEQLKKAIGDPPLLAICSDACKGLENAVKNVFPNAEQRECFYHLARNFKKRFRGFVQIYPAARAYREEIFYDNLAKMLSESSEAVQWLQANHKLLWYRCGFNPDIKCDYITSNIAESFNNWIRDHKDLPVADLADKIREMIMVLWHKRRIIAYRLPEGRILPAIMVQLRANTRGLGHLKIVKCSNWSAEVWDHSSGVSVRHIVKLEQRTCTCQEWQHTGKPCQHVLAYVTRQRGIDLEQFVHDYYSVNRFRAAYGREIEPMTDKTQWPEVDLPFLVGAPLAKLPPGRLRKLRIKGWMEGGHKKKGSKDEKFSNEMEGEKGCDNDTAPTNAKGKKMIRGPMTCKRCGEKGHRQASSKCPLNGTAKKRKRRQPRKNVTIQPAEPSTPRRLTREEILRDSPGRVTRSMLATLLGEGTSSQVDTNSPVRMPTAAAPKKMTPKRKLHIG